MNTYAAMAQRHWQRWLPRRYQRIRNPTEFFSLLGEQTAEQIQNLTDQLGRQGPSKQPSVARGVQPSGGDGSSPRRHVADLRRVCRGLQQTPASALGFPQGRGGMSYKE